MDLGNGYFLVRFNVKEDYDNVIKGGGGLGSSKSIFLLLRLKSKTSDLPLQLSHLWLCG